MCPFFIGRRLIWSNSWCLVSEQLRILIEPVVVGLGFEFWGLEYLSQG
ncbi:MAG: hypothetical protein ACI9W1_000359, partial [Candidatus Azotimanducaceae bacterium]